MKKHLPTVNFILLLSLFIYLLLSHQTKKESSEIIPEITTERLNIVDKTGNKYVVLSNPKRQALATQNGKVINPEQKGRNTAGLLFFNEEGDEVGGLVYGIDSLGSYQLLTFDQYKNDQIMALRKDEYLENGTWKKQYGLLLQERSDKSSKAVVTEFNQINKIKDSLTREQKLNEYYNNPENLAPQRLFLGRTYTENVGLYLMDKNNKIKLAIYVNPKGKPVLQYVDSLGNKKNLIK